MGSSERSTNPTTETCSQVHAWSCLIGVSCFASLSIRYKCLDWANRFSSFSTLIPVTAQPPIRSLRSCGYFPVVNLFRSQEGRQQLNFNGRVLPWKR